MTMNGEDDFRTQIYDTRKANRTRRRILRNTTLETLTEHGEEEESKRDTRSNTHDAAHQSRMQVLLRVCRNSITRLRLRERRPGSKKKQIWSRRLLLRVASRVHLGTETESAYKGGTLNIGIGSVDLTRLINTGPDLISDRTNSPNIFLTRYFAYKPHSLGLHPS